MERLQNQQSPEIIAPPEAGFQSLLSQIEARFDSLVVRTALALGALTVAQTGALEASHLQQDQHQSHVQTAEASYKLRAEIAVANNPKITAPKIRHPKVHAKPKPEKATPVIFAGAMPPDAATNNLAPYIALVPSLDQAAQRFPASFPRVAEEKAYIQQLAQEVQVSLTGYQHFTVDKSRTNAFRSFPYSRVKIHRPQSYVFHWTGEVYDKGGVDQLVHGMLLRHSLAPDGRVIPNRVSVFDFTASEGKVYQLLPNAHYRAAHAKGFNPYSVGNEMEAGVNQGRPASEAMFNITPKEVEGAIYAAEQFCISEGLPVNETSLVSHYEVDLLYNNDKYNPKTGVLAAGATLGKFDLPKEFMTQVVLPKAKALYAQLKKK